MIAPCKDCTDRYVSCHSSCDLYKKWRSDFDMEKSKIIQNMNVGHQADVRRMNAMQKAMKQQRRH